MKVKKFKQLQVGDKVKVRTWEEILALKGVEVVEGEGERLDIFDEKGLWGRWRVCSVMDNGMFGETLTITSISPEDDTIELDYLFWAVRKMLK